MLSGNASLKIGLQKTKYAADAILELFNQLNQLGSQLSKIEVCLVGGANVLKRIGDTIGENNIKFIEMLLEQKNIIVKKKALGGVLRRTVCLNIEEGVVKYTEGDSKQLLLYKFI